MIECSLNAIRRDAIASLDAAGVASPRNDVDLLLSHVIGCERGALVTVELLTANQIEQFEYALQRRTRREPLQHILGEAWFRHLRVPVGPGVFVPRPETELLVDAALESIAVRTRFRDDPRAIVVDLCTGSGVIAASVATEAANVSVTAVELDEVAAAWAKRTFANCSSALAATGSTIRLVVGDARGAGATILPELAGQVDIVAVNPPYIPDEAIPRDVEVRDYDPPVALFGGPDGLGVVRGLIEAAARLLKADGLLLMEHGDEQGGDNGVPGEVARSGRFRDTVDHQDLAGRPRFVSALRTS